MGAETIAMIAIQLVGFAALGGIGWNRLSAVEDRQDTMNGLLIDQNSRIDKLEEDQARREGWQEGYDQAKAKYGTPNRNLQD